MLPPMTPSCLDHDGAGFRFGMLCQNVLKLNDAIFAQTTN
jgi:hypothetical protein